MSMIDQRDFDTGRIVPKLNALTSTDPVIQVLKEQVQTIEQNKLDKIDYDPLHLGQFPSKAALDLAHPIGKVGNSADIDSGAGFDIMRAIWDDSDQKWVVREVNNASNTDQVPEGNLNKYFTTERVRQTPIGALDFLDSSRITQTDSIGVIASKLQAQLDRLTPKWVTIQEISDWVNPALVLPSNHPLRFTVIGGVLFVAGVFTLGGSDFNLCSLKPEFKMFNTAGVNGNNNMESVKCYTVVGNSVNSFFTQCPSGNGIGSIAQTYTNTQFIRTSRLSDTMVVNGFLGKLMHYN